MIVCKLQGGLGNQLFQWAYAKNLSIINGSDLYLDLGFLNKNLGVTKRNFSLNKFPNVKFDLISNKDISNEKFIVITEHSRFDFNSEFNYYLDGYFQSEKYFMQSNDKIRSYLDPNKKITISGLDSFSNTVSIHVRRTDYIKSNGYHPVQTIEYYQKSLEIIGEYENLLIFSDDISWCKSNFNFPRMKFIVGNDELDDLWTMSLCSHNIIANSSFSWWGAWLNRNPNKKVISPINWFGEHVNLDVSDIVPDGWIKI